MADHVVLPSPRDFAQQNRLPSVGRNASKSFHPSTAVPSPCGSRDGDGHQIRIHDSDRAAKSVIQVERLEALKKREENGYLYEDSVKSFLLRQPSHQDKIEHNVTSFFPIKLSWRKDICDWLYTLVEQSSDMSWEIATSAMSYLDRYLMASFGNAVNEEIVHLVALTALNLAAKLYGRPDSPIEGSILDIEYLLWLGRGQFTSLDLEKMEIEMLSTLSWKVHPPTSVDFVLHLFALLPAATPQSVVEPIQIYQAIKSACCCGTKDPQTILWHYAAKPLFRDVVSDPFFVDIPCSKIAYASVLNALEHMVMTTSEDKILAKREGTIIHSNDEIRTFMQLAASISPAFHPNDPQVLDSRSRLKEITSSKRNSVGKKAQ